MSWTPLLPPVKKPGPSRSIRSAAVVISAAAKTATGKDRLLIRVRPAEVEGGLAWWKAGGSVDVLVGYSEHAGWLRIQPGTTYPLRRAAKQDGGKMAMLVIPLPDTVTPGKRPTVIAEFDYNAGWIEVEVPASWRRSAAPPVAAAAPPLKTRYVGISEQLPDPAAQRRAVGRPLPDLGAEG